MCGGDRGVKSYRSSSHAWGFSYVCMKTRRGDPYTFDAGYGPCPTPLVGTLLGCKRERECRCPKICLHGALLFSGMFTTG